MKSDKKKSKAATIGSGGTPFANLIKVDINGYSYIFTDAKYLEALEEAVKDHVDADRAFTTDIVVAQEGQELLELYTPAILYTFGLIDKQDLLHFATKDIFSEDTTIEDNPDGT